jgi:RNA polymerase sigma factor (sigma-70 family)
MAIAKLAAEKELAKLAIDAARESLRGGLPVPDAAPGVGNTRAIPRVVSYSSQDSANTGETSQISLTVLQSLAQLARDLTQEIWIKVHRGLSGFRPGARFRPWLFSIALNHVRDEQRRVGRHPLQLLEETPAQSLPARQTDPRQASEEREAIEAALDRVPEPFRSALHLVDVVGLDYEEAARSLECAVGTVKSRVNRGRFAFRDAWLARGTPSEYRASIRKRRVEP